MRVAWWYVSKESTAEGPRFFAEVIEHPNSPRDRLLYATAMHTDVHSAINAAEAWMKKKGYVHGAEVGK